MLTIELIADQPGTLSVSAQEFGRQLEPVLQQHFAGAAVVEILLTNDERMRELNHTHRGIDATTDVLSLPTAIDSTKGLVVPPPTSEVGGLLHLGTIVISIPQAARQIGHCGSSLNDEILGLAAHGLRHLLGHDHDDEGEWRSH